MKEYAKKIRINAFDILIILLVLAVAAGVAVRYDLARRVGLNSKGDVFTLTVKIENIQDKSAQYFVPGADVFFDSNGVRMGTVGEVISIDPAAAYIQLTDGAISKTEFPERIDVVFTIRCSGVKGAEGYMINGTSVAAAGKEYKINTSGLSMTVAIIAVNDE